MKTEREKQKLQWFIGSLAVIALAINFFFITKETSNVVFKQQQQRETENAVAVQKAVQDVAAEHTRYLARYLNTGFARKQGTETVAVAAASEDGKLNRVVTAALVSRFQREPVRILSPFFKPEFVSDGLFNDAFTGSNELFNKLELAKSLDALLLARQDVQYSKNAALENVISATMQLKVVVVPVSGQTDGKTWTFTAYGPGFTKEVARQAAEERLIKQIATDTNMSLVLQNH
jgi:hypothetical protein